ncbi:hypothetical protein AX17_002394 [Amanita inopinata Kibby_2008]|nr:hypothetical protein AX17_002394 [Amanita inopinata Kibby_2008]
MIRRRLLSSFTAPISTSTSTSTSNFTNYRLPLTIRQLLASSAKTDHGSDEQVTVSGWIKSIRRQKNVSFAVVTDGSSAGGLQAVFVGAGKDSEQVKRLSNGAAVRLTGKLVASPGKGQDKELVVELTNDDKMTIANSGAQNSKPGRVELLGECPHDAYPIQKQALSTEYLRDHVHLRARTDKMASMIRLRSTLKRSINSWFEAQEFHYANTPILTENDAEGAGEAFRIAPVHGEHPAAIAARQSSFPSSSTANPSTTSTHPNQPTDFFSRPAYLTVSHQLHLESLASALSRVYTLSPCFRAERSLTGRHLSEFWMLEAEWAFAGFGRGARDERVSDVEEICKFVEGLLRNVIGQTVMQSSNQQRNEDIDVLWKQGDPAKLASLEDAVKSEKPWTRLSYTEAMNELEAYHASCGAKAKFQYEPQWGKGLQSEHERWLAEHLIGGPLFVTDYPSSLKPFYMRSNTRSEEVDGEAGTVACFDLLVPHIGELVGGSVREERLEILAARMEEAGLGGPEYEWYRDLRRYGGAPHGGFGMGFERLVAWLGGIDNVRECVPMPRWAGRILL